MRWRPKPPPRLNNYENNRFKTAYITKNNIKIQLGDKE